MNKLLEGINNIIKTLQKCRIKRCKGCCFSCTAGASSFSSTKDVTPLDLFSE